MTVRTEADVMSEEVKNVPTGQTVGYAWLYSCLDLFTVSRVYLNGVSTFLYHLLMKVHS